MKSEPLDGYWDGTQLSPGGNWAWHLPQSVGTAARNSTSRESTPLGMWGSTGSDIADDAASQTTTSSGPDESEKKNPMPLTNAAPGRKLTYNCLYCGLVNCFKSMQIDQ